MSLPLRLYRSLLSRAVNQKCDNDKEMSVSARSYADLRLDEEVVGCTVFVVAVAVQN